MTRLTFFSLVVLVCAGAACTTRASRESTSAACMNGVDDDGDGLVDCADTDCNVFCGRTDSGLAMSPDAWLPDGAQTDVGGCYDPIDLVFVLDVSTSMANEFARLRDGIASIFTAADALTTNHTFGLVVFVDDVRVVNGCSSFATAAALQAEFDHWRTFCASNGNPGTAGGTNSDCPENSLDALYDAATMCTWRAGATHIVIHVTDDTFRERPERFSADVTSAGVPAMHTYAEVSDALVAAHIHVGAFAQSTPMFCGAGTSANTAQGFFVSYNGAAPLPVSTSGRVWDIADVRNGTLDMATAINEMIAADHCAPF